MRVAGLIAGRDRLEPSAVDLEDVPVASFAPLDDQFERAAGELLVGEHVGQQPEDLADRDLFARLGPGPEVADSPACELDDDREERLAGGRELVFHARRELAVALARDESELEHLLQVARQDTGADPGQAGAQTGLAQGAVGERAKDQQRPLVADRERGACERRPLVVFAREQRRAGAAEFTLVDEGGMCEALDPRRVVRDVLG